LKKTTLLLLLAAALFAGRCASTPPPAAAPAGEDRYLIDPRTGYVSTLNASQARKFDAAWQAAIAGDPADARRRLDQLGRALPDYAPVVLAGAALDIRTNRLAQAAQTVRALLEKSKDYTAAKVYEAEIAFREKRYRAAWDLYRSIAAGKEVPPTVAIRLNELQSRVFDETLTAAKAATSDEETIRLLREALSLRSDAFEPRILLAGRLLARAEYDEARKEIEPLLNTAADRSEVQEILAEIDAGKGRYEEAIVRYERLSKRTKDPRHAQRLEEIKRDWSAANMPPYYRAALASDAVTREQLAVLLYWNVPSVRFARNLPTPPIATDVPDLEGREEVIRAIALGLYEVDPVTRLVYPDRVVTRERVARLLARVLTVHGAACARGLASDKVLAACAVESPLATATAPESPVTGRELLKALEQLAAALQ
jgi:tetratricopeptide (TPR) repeat protein